ncbi:MAG: hypothetical protein M2R45_05000 [Verrucomicrobia subdivision 3 bacterium]|nr:hypothetical protein [Limisphaerales bacterium]MCS1415597.1 hypothetical protein [Limisphaerales bacterium]
MNLGLSPDGDYIVVRKHFTSRCSLGGKCGYIIGPELRVRGRQVLP